MALMMVQTKSNLIFIFMLISSKILALQNKKLDTDLTLKIFKHGRAAGAFFFG